MRRWILTALLSFVACAQQGVDVFHVTRGNVSLPVYVQGNPDAKTILLYSHGGPGISQLDTEYEVIDRLDDQNLWIQWAQRSSAHSTGHPSGDTLGLKADVEDLQAVVQAVRSRYPEKNVVLMGYSWGGALTWGYLAGGTATDVDGAVVVAGPIQGRESIVESWSMITQYAQTQIAKGSDKSYWEGAVHDAAKSGQAIASVSAESYLTSYDSSRLGYCKSMSRDLKLDGFQAATNLDMFDPSFLFLIPGASLQSVVTQRMADDILALDYVDALSQVSVPILLIWGRHDCNVPIAVGEKAYDLLEHSAAAVTMVVSDISDHNVLWQDPNLVVQSVNEFLTGLELPSE